ncbi:glycosyltransferase [Methylocapsa sp. D3K7]|uniref:glycosyltransferase family 4 protein n=1 Tax=Methylocapsa sp. D3K7 TaxID=3041435 RepID=UPI00244E5D5A|nr:glycosyltransferase [Methylocapsa sp. D3K7]WGJ16191.1 glycosyltransferase [Methylocapsa sp. D3K7]
MKVLHVITDLNQGGAETVLYRLVVASMGKTEHVVVSLTDEGVYGPLFRELGVAIHVLGFPRGRVTLMGLTRLRSLIAGNKPDVVQTWMYHADLIGGLMARLTGIRAICWGIRNSCLNSPTQSKSSRYTAYLCSWLSSWVPAAIVSCSKEAAREHIKFGYQANKFAVIPNGYDLSRFTPQPHVGKILRGEWGVDTQLPVLGMVARWHPQKDHANLLAALSILAKDGWDFRCVLAGSGMKPSNASLSQLISKSSLQDKVILLGPRERIPDVMNALDIHVLSSVGEGFPNVVAEAMACGTPCVVTDVGDAALIVAATGWVAPPGDPYALAGCIEQAMLAIRSPRWEKISGACRQRIVECFGIDRMVAAYEDIWCKCLASK